MRMYSCSLMKRTSSLRLTIVKATTCNGIGVCHLEVVLNCSCHVPVLVFTLALHKSRTHYRVLKLLSSGMLCLVVYQTRRCHVPENSIFNIHRRKNLFSRYYFFETWDCVLLVIGDFSCVSILFSCVSILFSCVSILFSCVSILESTLKGIICHLL